MFINRRKGEEYGLWRYAVLYSELRGRLDALRIRHPQNMQVEVIGQSNEGRDILLVILAEDVSDAALRQYETIRRRAVSAPVATAEAIRAGQSHKMPIMFNCNLHGNEISGTDGMLTFITDVLDGPYKQDLEKVSYFISICMNPDGRARGFDILNGNGVDLNRDWMIQSQPETRALVTGILNRFYPVVMVDMHGFMGGSNVLIDACTKPHNPLVEYDLLEGHLLENSRAMRKVITARTGVEVDIPAEMWEDGWEDYSPIYTAVYFLCFGAISHTIETNYPSEEGAEIMRCAAMGTTDYVRDQIDALLLNQCEFFKRGLDNKPYAFPMPNFYRIPVDGQRDLKAVFDTIGIAVENKVRVYTDAKGAFVVPAAQALRPFVHNMFWEGEDISDKIQVCYDISFYSHPIMRGFDIERLERFDEPLVEVKVPALPVYPQVHLGDAPWAFSCQTLDAVLLANTLLRRGVPVWREDTTGNYVVADANCKGFIQSFSLGNHLRAEEIDPDAKRVPLKLPRILVVGDSGCLDEMLCELGFDSEFLLFSELNRGYRIDESRYDILVAGGTEYYWEDVFDEQIGCSFQVSWGMRPRAKKELLRAAENMKHRVLFGFAGNEMNKALGIIPAALTEAKKPDAAEDGNTSALANEKWVISVPNGSFRLEMDTDDVLCKGYRESELLYLIAPMLYQSAEAKAPIRFAKTGSFINGFNKRKGETDGQIAAFHKISGGQKDVILGFDPNFRKYLDAAYRVLLNAIYPPALPE